MLARELGQGAEHEVLSKMRNLHHRTLAAGRQWVGADFNYIPPRYGYGPQRQCNIWGYGGAQQP